MSKNSDIYLKIIKDINILIKADLNNEKIALATEKIKLRYKSLKMDNIENYYDYYLQNVEVEIKNLISILTNHTTEFFREAEHFNFLADEVFPEFIKNKKPIRIWSAASSIGKEAYSIAMCYLEVCYNLGISANFIPPIEILGTDLDSISVEKSNNGIYLVSEIEKEIGKNLIQKYFDIGEKELKKYARIKDIIHNICKFKTHNLLSSTEDIGKFNVIFIRNVIIYYKRKEVKNIILTIKNHLEKDGYLILGHSESLSRIDVPFTHLKNSIYKLNQDIGIDYTKIFIIDNTLIIKNFLKKILTPNDNFLIVGEADDPIEAIDKLKKIENQPHVIIIDINTPKMNGIEFLEFLKDKPHPPIIVMSAFNSVEADKGIKCLELGAFDYIEKPNGLFSASKIEYIKNTILQARKSNKENILKNEQCSNKNVINNLPKNISKPDLIAIGSSTGGVEALQIILSQLNKNFPPIVIVQHIPEYFSNALANRLNKTCNIKIYEGKQNQILEPNCVYLAPGGKQMKIFEKSNNLYLEINDSEKVNMHKPSIDYMFYSLANLNHKINICALILTGMGNDGAKGLKKLYDKNAFTIAQDESTSIVFGMPKEAIALGGVNQIASIHEIPNILKKII